MNSIYEEIGRRTDGNIYLAVVGPVRTGKSTFAKRFMEQLVIPSIDNVYHRERARDELHPERQRKDHHHLGAEEPVPPSRRWRFPPGRHRKAAGKAH